MSQEPTEADACWLQTEESLCLMVRSARVTLAKLPAPLRSPMMVALGVVMAIANDAPMIAEASSEPLKKDAVRALQLDLAEACVRYMDRLMGPDVPEAFRRAFD